MKNKVISVVVVIIMLVAIGFAYKTGRLNVNPGAVSDNGQKIAHGPVLKEPEKHTKDKMILLNKGEEGIYENLKKDIKGNTAANSMRYNFKYIDCAIAKEKPEGIEITFYKDNEERIDSEGRFIDDTYYVTVDYEITNMKEDDWEILPFSPQNLKIGYYDDNGFTVTGEARGNTVDGDEYMNGGLMLDKGERAVIRSCYFLKQAVIDKGNIVVEAELVGQNEALRMPYFVLEFDEVTE